MLSDKDFSEFLNDNALDGSMEKRLSRIIDEEMEKPEEEMDTELIEYCLDKLSRLEAKAQNTEEKKDWDDTNGKTIRLNRKKWFAAIAAAVMLFVGGLSVSANVFNRDLFGGIVEEYKDFIRINFDKSDNKANDYRLLGTELAQELTKNGFSAVLLPEALFSDEYNITKIEYEKFKYSKNVNIIFEYKNKLGCINISKYAMKEIVPDVEFLNVTSNIEELTIGNAILFSITQGYITLQKAS